MSSRFGIDMMYRYEWLLAMLTVSSEGVKSPVPSRHDAEFINMHKVSIHRRAKSTHTSIQRQIELLYLPAVYIPAPLPNYVVTIPMFRSIGTQTDVERIHEQVRQEAVIEIDSDEDGILELIYATGATAEEDEVVAGMVETESDGNLTDEVDSNYPELKRRHIDPFVSDCDYLRSLGYFPRPVLSQDEIVKQGKLMAEYLKEDPARWKSMRYRTGCWNCRSPGHQTSTCVFIRFEQNRGTYCFRCGAARVNVNACAFCNWKQYPGLVKPVELR